MNARLSTIGTDIARSIRRRTVRIIIVVRRSLEFRAPVHAAILKPAQAEGQAHRNKPRAQGRAGGGDVCCPGWEEGDRGTQFGAVAQTIRGVGDLHCRDDLRHDNEQPAARNGADGKKSSLMTIDTNRTVAWLQPGCTNAHQRYAR